jgi:hypothetical protein
MNNLSQFFKVVTIAHFALMHTLQNPNVLTPCIRLSAVAPQPRAAVRALRGHPGEKGEDRDSGTSPGPQWRLGRARRGTAKAVTGPQGSRLTGSRRWRHWREGERETGADYGRRREPPPETWAESGPTPSGPTWLRVRGVRASSSSESSTGRSRRTRGDAA